MLREKKIVTHKGCKAVQFATNDIAVYGPDAKLLVHFNITIEKTEDEIKELIDFALKVSASRDEFLQDVETGNTEKWGI